MNIIIPSIELADGSIPRSISGQLADVSMNHISDRFSRSRDRSKAVRFNRIRIAQVKND